MGLCGPDEWLGVGEDASGVSLGFVEVLGEVVDGAVESAGVVSVLDSSGGESGFDFFGGECHWVVLLGCKNEAPRLEEGGDDSVVAVDVGEDFLHRFERFDAGDHALWVVLVCRTRLHSEDSVVAHRIGGDLEVLLGEKELAGAVFVGVWKVAKDDVEVCAFVVDEPLASVAVEELGTRILECALVPFGHVDLDHIDEFFVDIDHDRLFNGVVFESLSKCCAFSATADHNRLRVRMEGHCGLAHALVEDVLIHDRGLDVVVQEERFSETGDVADLVGLILGFPFENHLLDSVLPDCRTGVRFVDKDSGCVAAHLPGLL